MTTLNDKRTQILESLGSLDPVQAEKVLEYIKCLIQAPQQDESYLKMKRQAMRQIQLALGKVRKLSPGL